MDYAQDGITIDKNTGVLWLSGDVAEKFVEDALGYKPSEQEFRAIMAMLGESWAEAWLEAAE
jgi:hypothetical protein